MADALHLDAADAAIAPFVPHVVDALVVSVCTNSTPAADEIIIPRAVLNELLRVDWFSRQYDKARFFVANPRGGLVPVRARGVPGELIALNAETPGVLLNFLFLAGVGLGFRMAITQMPFDGEIEKRQLQPFAANGGVQEVVLGVLPVRPHLNPHTVIDQTDARIRECVERQAAELAAAVRRGDGAAANAARQNMIRARRVLRDFLPDFRRAFLAAINKCKPWNARQGGGPDIDRDLPANGAFVGIVLPSGVVVKAKFTRSYALSINFRAEDIGDHLTDVGIHTGDHVAYTPCMAAPPSARGLDVRHFFLVTKLPRARVGAATFVEQWEATTPEAPQVAHARVNALRAQMGLPPLQAVVVPQV